MAMNSIDLLLDQFDAAWKHKWESILAALDQTTEEEALWQPPGYDVDVVNKGCPRNGSVLWQITHIAASKRGYLEFIKHRASRRVPYSSRTPECSFAAEMEYLKKTQAELRDTLSHLTDIDLVEEVLWCEETLPLYQYVNMIIRHDLWHAGQIRAVRSLRQRIRQGMQS